MVGAEAGATGEAGLEDGSGGLPPEPPLPAAAGGNAAPLLGGLAELGPAGGRGIFFGDAPAILARRGPMGGGPLLPFPFPFKADFGIAKAILVRRAVVLGSSPLHLAAEAAVAPPAAPAPCQG